MSLKWSADDIIYFLEVYEKYNDLWNTKAKYYRDRSVRDNAFVHLVNELKQRFPDITIELVRIKIKTIKTVLSQELGRIAKSRSSSETGNGKLYQPKLVWFNRSKFLHDCTNRRELYVPMDENTNESTKFLQALEVQLNEVKSEIIEYPEYSNKNITDNDNYKNINGRDGFTGAPIHLLSSESSNRHQLKQSSRISSSALIQHQQEHDFMIGTKSMHNNNMQHIKNATIQNSSCVDKIDNTADNNFDFFGKYVSFELRSIKSIYLQKKLKRKILQAIVDIGLEEEATMFNDNSKNNSNSNVDCSENI